MTEEGKAPVSEVVEKNGVDYFIQEMHHGPKSYLAMTRRVRDVLDCEREAVEEMPSDEL